ncbi:MAG TPA: hypothetical protein VNU01_05430, partial [Egibacteraceae bacterium]|nr:hypothetical protein [Egibacteraceae bacterium]
GAVQVLGAELPFDIFEAGGIGWCPQVERFVQIWGAAQFRRDGTWMGGPAPGGMERYAVSRRDGRLVVRESLGVPPRDEPSAYQPPVWRDNECWSRTGHDLDLDQVLLHGEPFADAITVRELRGLRNGSATVFGNAVGRGDGGLELCDELAGTRPPRCADPLVRRGDGGRDLSGYGYEGWFEVRMRHGVPVRVALRAMTRPAGWEAPAPDPRIRVEGPEGRHLTVPAFDFDFADGPDQPLPAGSWSVQLVNHGTQRHGLRIEPGPVLDMRPGRTYIAITAPFDLPPGDYVAYCPVPGHREAGMEFAFQVR